MGRRKTRGQRVSPLRALADINVVYGETLEGQAARREVLRRWARMDGDRPALCAPPMCEQRMGRISGAFKVIYDTEDNARSAAGEFYRLGAPPQVPYDDCPYGDHHFHLGTLQRYSDEKKRSNT